MSSMKSLGQKHIRLLLQLEAAHLILTPSGISNRTKNLLEKHGLLNKEKLRAALNSRELIKIPCAGERTCQEACWWLIYGYDAERARPRLKVKRPPIKVAVLLAIAEAQPGLRSPTAFRSAMTTRLYSMGTFLFCEPLSP